MSGWPTEWTGNKQQSHGQPVDAAEAFPVCGRQQYAAFFCVGYQIFQSAHSFWSAGHWFWEGGGDTGGLDEAEHCAVKEGAMVRVRGFLRWLQQGLSSTDWILQLARARALCLALSLCVRVYKHTRWRLTRILG